MVGNTISIYTTSAFPYGGAAESFVRNMALGIQKNNIKVVVNKLRGDDFQSQVNNTGIEARYILFKNRPKLEFIKLVELILLLIKLPFSTFYSKYHDKSNVIILYGIEYSYLSFPIRITAKLLNQRVFRIITDDYPVSTIKPQWWKTPKLQAYIRQYEKIDKKLDGIICLSHYLVEHSLKNGVKKDNVLLIPHFINVDSFVNESKQIKKENNRIRIGYVGAIIEPNGIIDLINAFRIVYKSYKNTELIIAGNLSNISSAIAEIFETAKKDFGNHIILPGMIPTKEIPKLLQSCDILVNPRKSSTFAEAGFPTKIGEYLASKRPVVATNVGDIKKYFKDERELLLAEANNPDSIAQNIITLIESQELQESMVLNAYLWAKQNLDYIYSASRLMDFIKGKTDS